MMLGVKNVLYLQGRESNKIVFFHVKVSLKFSASGGSG